MPDKKEPHETTFKETSAFLETHGWEKISKTEYTKEKLSKKHQTARVGLYLFFKLKKSNKEINNGM